MLGTMEPSYRQNVARWLRDVAKQTEPAISPSLKDAVQASGGVKTLQDIRDAKAAGTGGAILGRALLERRFTLQEALAC